MKEKQIAEALVQEAQRRLPRHDKKLRWAFWDGFWAAARAVLKTIGADPQEVERRFDEKFE